MYDGIVTDTMLAFMGAAYKCIKCGRRVDFVVLEEVVN